MAKKINYFARNFLEVRQELVNFIQRYYPDIYSDFNDASVGMMLLELNAAVSDMLGFNIDRTYQETQVDYAQERKSLLSLARTFGLKLPGKRPAVTLVDWSVTVPVDGDGPDERYLPIIVRGSQATGGGKIFETLDDIDFTSQFSLGGLSNRTVIPNVDSNGNIVNYTITKRELVVNGFTKIIRRVIFEQDSKPFFDYVLPDSDVLSIEQIIMLEGTDFTTNPSTETFLDFDNRWFEVDALAEDKTFIEDTTRVSDTSSIKPGKWVNVPQRFVKEYTDKGFCKITFGSGVDDINSLNDFLVGCDGQLLRIGNFVNNFSLGEVPVANTTMFVRYRVGGGANSNVGPNLLTSKGLIDIRVEGPNDTENQLVTRSLTVNNPIPALGGADELSTEDIRNLIKYNFSAQNRCVTIKDYLSRIMLMPSRFGVPYRANVWEEQNKIVVSVIGLDENSKLTNQSTTTLKENVARYLSDYRMINDFVEISDGRIINLGVETDLFIDNAFSRSEVATNVITVVNAFMDKSKIQMGENIYLSQLIEQINNVGGVLNVVDLRIFNKVGDPYSLNEISQPYSNEETRQIDLLGEFALFFEPNEMPEIKFGEKDISVRFKG